MSPPPCGYIHFPLGQCMLKSRVGRRKGPSTDTMKQAFIASLSTGRYCSVRIDICTLCYLNPAWIILGARKLFKYGAATPFLEYRFALSCICICAYDHGTSMELWCYIAGSMCSRIALFFAMPVFCTYACTKLHIVALPGETHYWLRPSSGAVPYQRTPDPTSPWIIRNAMASVPVPVEEKLVESAFRSTSSYKK